MTSAYDRVTDRLTEVTGHRGNGSGWRCPAHADRTPSLSVTAADDRVLLCCQAGCDRQAVLAALSLTDADLFDAPKTNGHDEPLAVYRYVDEADELLFEVVRFPGKKFLQRRPDGAGGWIWKLGDVRRPLYHLPRVLEAVAEGRAVFVCEGEKDVEALERAGEVATCNPGGAGKWRPEHAAALAGAAEVIIVADTDAPGAKHAADIESSLVGLVERVLVVEAKTGKDAADHLGAGHTVAEFEVVGQGGPVTPVADPTLATFFVDWPTFWERDRRQAEWLFDDVLARGRGHSLFAGHKVGKSLFMLHVATQLAQRPDVVVIYLDFEMGEDDLYDRLEDMGYGPGVDLSRLRYAVLPSLPPLDQPDGAKALLERVDAVQAAYPGHHLALVIDTTGRAVAGEENSADTIRAFYRWTGLGLKQRGITWARLDHAGKDATKGQRGTSAKGDDVDVVWRLSRTDGGLELRREAARMGWVPERVAFEETTVPHLRFVRVADWWPAGTKELAALLDGLEIDPAVGERPAGQALRDAGHKVGQFLVRAAQKYRRQSLEQGLR